MPFDTTQIEVVNLALRNTRTYLQHGWTQSEAQNGLAFCLFGAIREATKGWNNNPVFQMTMERMASVLPDSQHTTVFEKITAWNDAAGRTKEEVLSKVDEAIDGTSGL